MPWLDTPRSAEPSPRAVHFAVVLAAFLAIRAVASVESDPVAAAEGGFLALLAGGVLASLSILAPRPAWELGWTALLCTTAIWVVGYGPHRGALVTLLLLGSLVVATRRAGRAGAVLSSPGRSAALALGLQILVRSDLLLLPLLEARTLVSVLALPVVSGVALYLLGRRFGPRTAWIAGAAAFVLSPGWNVTVTLALGSLAAGVVVADRDLPGFLRSAAAAVLLVPPLWDDALGTLFVLGALTFLVEGRTSWLLSMAGITVLVWNPPVRLGAGLLAFWSQALVLVPALAAGPREGHHLVLRGGFLSLVAAMLGGGPEVLAGGLALAVLGLGRNGASGSLPLVEMQHAWVSVLGLGAALMATYPWLRQEPVADFLELLGLRSPRMALAAAVVLVIGLGLALELWRRRFRAPRPAWVLTLAVLLALARALPFTALVPVSFEPQVLDAENPVWLRRFPALEITGGVIDSHLAHGAGLELGTRVATVRVRGADLQLLGSWDILAGFDTAEWAAARPDVAGRPGFRAPEAWLSQVTADRTFFSQRFRSRFHISERLAAATVVVRRNPDLPPAVELTIYRLELRR